MNRSIVIRCLVFGLCLLILAGCGGRGRSVGRMIDTTHVNDIQKGITTKEQVRAWFGKPYATGASKEFDSQGRPLAETWIYSYGWSNLRNKKSQALTVVFDANGKVISSNFNEKYE